MPLFLLLFPLSTKILSLFFLFSLTLLPLPFPCFTARRVPVLRTEAARKEKGERATREGRKDDADVMPHNVSLNPDSLSRRLLSHLSLYTWSLVLPSLLLHIFLVLRLFSTAFSPFLLSAFVVSSHDFCSHDSDSQSHQSRSKKSHYAASLLRKRKKKKNQRGVGMDQKESKNLLTSNSGAAAASYGLILQPCFPLYSCLA